MSKPFAMSCATPISANRAAFQPSAMYFSWARAASPSQCLRTWPTASVRLYETSFIALPTMRHASPSARIFVQSPVIGVMIVATSDSPVTASKTQLTACTPQPWSARTSFSEALSISGCFSDAATGRGSR